MKRLTVAEYRIMATYRKLEVVTVSDSWVLVRIIK